MKYIDLLKENNVFDFSSNDLNIKKIKSNRERTKALIELEIKYPLTLKEYEVFYNFSKEQFKKANADEVFLNITYLNDFQNEADAILYLENIINYLSKTNRQILAFKGLKIRYENKNYHFIIDADSTHLKNLDSLLTIELEKYGINAKILYDIDKTLKTLSEFKDESALKSLEVLKRKSAIESHEAEMKNNKFNYKERRKPLVEKLFKIKEIPNTQEGLLTYQETEGQPNFKIRGEIFLIEVEDKKTKLGDKKLGKISVFDDTDSIFCQQWLSPDKDLEAFSKFKCGDIVEIIGKAQYSFYQKDVILNVVSITFIEEAHKTLREDNASVKRVELHAHTKMSTLDGLADVSDYLKTVKKWGWKAMAFTDHNGIYEFSDIAHQISKDDDFKPIYGVELNFIDDTKYKITFTNESLSLKDQTYVVFDLETTGLSQEYDHIIEIAAIKVKGGAIVDKFETFVNPKMHIPELITNLTSITDDDVKESPTIDIALPQFLEFIEGSVLVAHNATFDVNMIYRNMSRLGYPKKEYPVIDTLNLFRASYNKDVLGDKGVAYFSLKYLSKYFKVKQEHHHRAIDDTRVTAECFILMLNDLYQKKIYDYKDINSLIDPTNFYKHVIPSHINIIAKNQTGLKNLYKLLSDSLTIHCFGEARLLRSVLDRFREGLFVSEGCYKSNMFEAALNQSEDDLKEIISYLDYVEVQPPLLYYQISSQYDDGDFRIKDTIKRIIRVANDMNKLVCATGDCHYISPQDKKYRDILIDSPVVGGGTHDLFKKDAPFAHLRTTNEMIEEFDFLEYDKAYEIVVTNTNKIASEIEKITIFNHEMYAPLDDQFSESLGVPSIIEEMKRIVYENLEKLYGKDDIHPIIQKRLDRELNSIISNGYSSTYYMAHLMVLDSVNHGYMVGSRGSVGSSFVATLMDITEINPLPPHFRCKKCKFTAFKMTDEEKILYGVRENEKQFQDALSKVESGYDLPDAICPCCGTPLTKDGHEIPFETFLGFNGDKVPDIDLNFSSEYQSRAHQFVKEVFGVTHSFRAGTLQTIADKNAYGYVKAYCEKHNLNLRGVEISRLAQKITGIKRSTGQHPGGIVVVPKYKDIFDVTPIQFASDKTDNEWMTTHFDYHSFEDNLLKLDCLGHDDPTLIRYFMDYVNAHQDKYPFSTPQEIPIDDKEVYKMFCSTDIVGVTPELIDSKVASYAVPEFGTNFVRQMLNDTMPQTFAQLVKISGLSHGTNVWLNNAQDLVLGKTEYGDILFKDIIGCRDDIMIDLINMGCEPLKSFQIMEFIRKGKAKKDTKKWDEYAKYLKEHNVPDWYIWSCNRIEYLFPKAHATAYVLMALRIAWFKLYSPALFYSGWFSKRAKKHSVNSYLKGNKYIQEEIKRMESNPDKTNTDDDTITSLQVAQEMTARNLKFLPIDINISDALIFEVESDDSIRIPFVAVDGLGEAVATSITKARLEKPFTSIKDIQNRTRLSKTLMDKLKEMGAFGTLPEEEKEVEQGLFAFMID